MMLIQSGSVLQILSGRDTGWDPQRRDDGSIPLTSIARRHRSHALLGVITLFAAALDLPVAGVVDVADDRRPDPVDPALLGQRPAVDRPRHAADRPPAHARGDDAAAGRRARQRARRRTRPRRPRPRRRARVASTPTRSSAPCTKPSCRKGRATGLARSMSTLAVATVKLNDAETVEDACAWLDAQGAGRRARRPRADRPARPPAQRRAGG